MIPQHNNPEYWRYSKKKEPFRAKAPYNFVPLPESIVTTESIPELDRYRNHTGYIDCTLKTETPLYTRLAVKPEFFSEWGDKIREMMKDRAAREEYAQFFHIDQLDPIIPGSSLRGMIRSLVEIGGFGKMQWVTNEPLVYRAVGDRSSLGEFYRVRMMLKEAGVDREMRFTPLMKAGYLEDRNGKWCIRPAVEHSGTSFARIRWYGDPRYQQRPSGNLLRWHGSKNAFHIWIQPGANEFHELRRNLYTKFMTVVRANPIQTNGMLEGVLVKSGQMQNKKYEAVVFLPDGDDSKLIDVSDEILHLYREQITQEQHSLVGVANHEGLLIDKQPVFYLVEHDTNHTRGSSRSPSQRKLVFFGHTMMFRLPYQQSPIDFVPAHLRDNKVSDLADAIFGSASDKKSRTQNSHAGRVFFMNARPKSGEGDLLYEEPITPKILASPKPTTFQHYLTQQEPDTLDTGKVDRSGNPKTELHLQHYANSPDSTAIRGHKLYWHKGKDFNANSIVDQEFVGNASRLAVEHEDIWLDGRELDGTDRKADSQHTVIRPVKVGKCFDFRVYFENLRDVELGALLWALSLPSPEGSQHYRHKLGMGKPIGLGTVHITVDQLVLSQREHTNKSNPILGADNANTKVNGRYESLFSGSSWYEPESIEDPTPFVAKFMAEVTRHLVGGETGLSFYDLPRLKMLGKLLQFPGPNEQFTQYMSLPEFKERPVLPDPFRIAAKLKSEFRPATENRNSFGIELPSETSTEQELAKEDTTEYQPNTQLINDVLDTIGKRRPAQSEKEAQIQDSAQVSSPTTFDELRIGMLIKGSITQIMFNQVQLDFNIRGVAGKLEEKDMHAQMLDARHRNVLKIGDKVTVRVKRIDKKGKPITVASVSLL